MTDHAKPLAELAGLADCDELPQGDWRRLAGSGHPFANPDFFATLEAHETAGPQNGWQALHWLARDENRGALGLIPSYIKSHSHGDFLRDWSWAGAYQQVGKDYYPKLFSGWPHTPASGRRILLAPTAAPDTAAQMIRAVQTWVAERGFSSWHFALPQAEEVELLRAHDFVVSHDVQFHWHNRGYAEFGDYLARFPSEKRRKIKAERRKVAESGLSIAVRHGDEVAPEEWPALHALYANTFDRYRNHAAFSANCFAELGHRLERGMVLFIAYDQGQPVAVSICFRSASTLYGRYWGCASNYNSLHFDLCFYQGIAYCIAEGLAVFEPGAGGEHKIARGFEPTVVRSCHWIVDTRMRQLIGQHLERHRAAILAYADEAASHLPLRPAISTTTALEGTSGPT